jgi:hypothetical protein
MQVWSELGASETHSFVIKVWCEEPAHDPIPALWRGHITHVPSGRRQYFQDLTVVLSFVGPYLTDSAWANPPEEPADE